MTFGTHLTMISFTIQTESKCARRSAVQIVNSSLRQRQFLPTLVTWQTGSGNSAVSNQLRFIIHPKTLNISTCPRLKITSFTPPQPVLPTKTADSGIGGPCLDPSPPVRVCFAGVPDAPAHASELKDLAREKQVHHRVKWLGFISEEEKHRFYAQAKAVVFPPLDEDYGYVTLEAMLSSKPVITCTDSGGPLEFIRHEETGLISKPTPSALADAFDRIWDNPKIAKSWGEAGRDLYDSMDITWSNVTERLLA